MINILVAEDDKIHQKLTIDTVVKSDLKKYGEINIEAVSSGEEALEYIEKKHSDIVLLDFNLGGEVNGLDVLKNITDKKLNSAVILVTGSGNERIAVEAIKNGAYDYIVKTPDYLTVIPVVVEQTLQKIEMEREQKKYHDRINDLLRASIGITKFDDLNKLLEFILKLACSTLEADGGSIMLYDKEKNDLEVRVAIGSRASEIIGKRLAIGERIAGLVADERKPILLVGDLKKYPIFKDLAKYEEIYSGMTVVISKKELLGIMNIKRTVKKEEFTEQDINILSIFAGNVTTTIETMKVYTELTETKQKLDEKLKELRNVQYELTRPERITILSEFSKIISYGLRPHLDKIYKITSEIKHNKNVKNITSELKVAENYINNLLFFAGDDKIDFKPANVNDIIDETLDSISGYISSNSLIIKKEFDPRVPLIFTDSQRLTQVFINLILNSIESINPEIKEHKLEIITKLVNGDIEKMINIRFKDNGQGIFHKEECDKVFSLLYTTKINKPGLGLFVSRKIISAHRGTIELNSKFQEFAEVVIDLPIKLNA